MVRLDPIRTDPDEDRMHNKFGAAMLGAVLGGVIGFLVGYPLFPKTFLALGSSALVGAIAVGTVGFWLGERFTYFFLDWLRHSYRRGPFDRFD